MLPVIQIGPLSAPLPGLLLILGVWLGLSLAEKHSTRHSVKVNHLYNLVFIALVTGVISARLAYVVRYPGAFAGSPLSVFSFTPTLLDPWAGAAAGILIAAIYGQKQGLRLWPTLDALVPLLAVFNLTLALSNLASGAAFGVPTSLPWGIPLWGEIRHPTQAYQALLAVFILWALWPVRGVLWSRLLGSADNAAAIPHAGSVFLAFVGLSAMAHLLVETFRDDSILWVFGLRVGQILAWAILAGTLWFLKAKLTSSQLAASGVEK